jgi:tetratricopeptide (TPR) repeat protein
VILFSSESEFRAYTTGPSVGGFYHAGREREYIVLHAGEGLTRVTAHEYVHSLLDHSKARFPRWFDEGYAEFYSTIEVSSRGVTVGAPIPAHQRVLAGAHLLSANELDRAGKEARHAPNSGELLYAEGWALVHMLHLSPAWKSGMPALIEELASNTEFTRAFRKAFGKTLDDAIRDLPSYLLRIRPAVLPGLGASAKETPVRQRLSADRASVLRGDLALQVKNLKLAQSLFEGAASGNPNSADALAGLGAIALAEDRKADAEAYLKRALDLRAPGGEVLYQRAILLRDEGAPASEVDELMDRAVTAEPALGEAHFQIGLRALDTGDLPRAMEHLEVAAHLLPRQSYIWHELAYAQMKAGLYEEAQRSAERAYQTAESPDHAKMASTLLEALDENSPR